MNDYDEPRLIQRVTVLGDHPAGGAPRRPHWQPKHMSDAVAGEMGVSGGYRG